MTLEEPHAIGDSPEDRARAARRKQNIRRAAYVVAVLIVVAVVIALLPTTPSKTVYVDPIQSSCKSGGNTMTCTIVLDARQGSTITVADIKSVQINDTVTTPTIKATGASVTIVASVPAPFKDQNGASIPDVGGTASPMANGQVVVYLTDGTTVSAAVGPAGILQ